MERYFSLSMSKYVEDTVKVRGVQLHMNRLILFLVGMPFLILIGAYVYLALYHQNPFLLNTIIHENGRDTLLTTVFYWDHFLAMLPHLLILISVLVSAFLFYGPTVSLPDSESLRQKLRFYIIASGGSCLLFISITFCISLSQIGWQETMVYFLQHRRAYQFGYTRWQLEDDGHNEYRA